MASELGEQIERAKLESENKRMRDALLRIRYDLADPVRFRLSQTLSEIDAALAAPPADAGEGKPNE